MMVSLSLRRFFPRHFWGRSALIVLVPIFLIQIVSGYIFFGRHWETITRHLSEGMAYRLATAAHTFETSPSAPEERLHVIEGKWGLLADHMTAMPTPIPRGYHVFQSRFERALRHLLPYPYILLMGPDITHVWIQLPGDVLKLSFPTKRVLGKTSLWWFLWSLVSAVLCAMIAAFFMHRQLVPLAQLSRLASHLERGGDLQGYFARGALEFRQIGKSLVSLYQKLLKKNKDQLAMLMGLSHDLRTPLSRMKLQLALLDEKTQGVASLHEDISHMEAMLASYIDFLKTGMLDAPQKVVVLALVFRVLKRLNAQHKKKITLSIPKGYRLFISEHALERCIQNIMENALFYAKERIHCCLEEDEDVVSFYVEDDGPGVKPSMLASIFDPFVRLSDERPLREGSTGLGLAVVRSFVHNMGGDVYASVSPQGGLRVNMQFKKAKSQKRAS
ncbi:HAMP domain-containing histidine kinase [bacterium NHP-B]|nr:HAMP domain-containing histidine kinase [bacterium NHP-B]